MRERDADMPCLVVALPSMARPGRRRPSTSVHRRGSTLAALPSSRCRCGRRHLIGASSAAALPLLLAPPSPAAPPIDPEVSFFARCSSLTLSCNSVSVQCTRCDCSLSFLWVAYARESAPLQAGLVRGVLCHGHGPGHEVIRSRGVQFCVDLVVVRLLIQIVVVIRLLHLPTESRPFGKQNKSFLKKCIMGSSLKPLRLRLSK